MLNIRVSERSQIILIFCIAFIFRYLFSLFSGIGNFEIPDIVRYMAQSDSILEGRFNLDGKLFITAPLFPYILAFFKFVFGASYIAALEIFQITLSSISVVMLMQTAYVIFKDQRIKLLVGIAMSIYPVTLYYVHQFSQESIFQSLFIISIYYYSVFFTKEQIKDLILFSVFFALALLTKSIILLMFPFLMISLLFKFQITRKKIFQICCSVSIILLITAPYGIYNKVVNNTYVIASSGQGGLFLTGHNDDFYTYVVNPPPNDSSEYQRLKNMDYKIFEKLESQITNKDHKFQQATYLNAGIEWSLQNPDKFFHLLWVNIRNFLQPGFNIFHHPFNLWLLTFLMSAPVYVLAYIEIIRRLLIAPRDHLAIASIFLGMISVAIIFYHQGRFRAITVEPFYLMYACSCFIYILQTKLKLLKKTEPSNQH